METGKAPIHPLRPAELDAIATLWLNANLQAHHFVDPTYWRENLPAVRALLPQAEVYVYGEPGAVRGFIGITDGDYIAGIFVAEDFRSRGVGKALLDHAKHLHPLLKLHVYQKNTRAVRFYLREGFTCVQELVDGDTGEPELLLQWEKKS